MILKEQLANNNRDMSKKSNKIAKKIRRSNKKCGLIKSNVTIDNTGTTTVIGRFIIPLKLSN